MFFWNSLAFSMIQQMLAIWSLVPLPFLKPAWTSGSSRFTYCWSLPGLENFEHCFTSVWDECYCVVVWGFFGAAFLRNWNENWPFPRMGLGEHMYWWTRTLPCAAVPASKSYEDRKSFVWDLALCFSSSGCWFISFNTLCNKLVVWWVNQFPEFCEPLWQINGTQRWSHGNLWFIDSCSEAQ